MLRSQVAYKLLLRVDTRPLPGGAGRECADFYPLMPEGSAPSVSETMQTSFAFPFEQADDEELFAIMTFFRAD